MTYSEILRVAIESLLINRLRSFLTTLGIVIGVGAVIGLVSLGRAVEVFIASEFESLGSNILEVSSRRPSSPTRTRIEPLSMRAAADLANPLNTSTISQIAVTYGVFGQIQSGSNRLSLSITGVSANYAQLRSWPLLYGSFIEAQDVEETTRVAVLGLDVVESLFGQRFFNPVGQIIRINDRSFTVIGVMTERGGTFVSQDNVILIPITTAQTRLANARAADGSYIVSRMYVQVRDEGMINQATQEITAYLSEKHRVMFPDEQDFQISNSSDILSIINQVSGVLTVFLVMIAGISLLVGGIGIMNIMLVSVTERTREIGLRKALGAKGSDILLQFLTESIALSLLGGVVGILIAWLATSIGTALIPELTIQLSADAVLLATGVSSFVGAFFGFYPASRAAGMRPIDALRFE